MPEVKSFAHYPLIVSVDQYSMVSNEGNYIVIDDGGIIRDGNVALLDTKSGQISYLGDVEDCTDQDLYFIEKQVILVTQSSLCDESVIEGGGNL